MRGNSAKREKFAVVLIKPLHYDDDGYVIQWWRGRPFNCSFCTIINAQARKSRHRTADDIERLIRANHAADVQRYFITDDDFARKRNWEAILDHIIMLREQEKFRIHLTIQVDTQCHKTPGFVEKAALAGCIRVFLGLESINPDSLKSSAKGQNKIADYRAMLQSSRRAGVMTYVGYIIGFPSDTPETIARDIGIIQRELPIDLLEFFVLTPLPGSRDHRDAYLSGGRLDQDINRYDTDQVTIDHPLMSRTQWQSIYEQAWHLYYSPEHIATLIKRATATGINASRLTSIIFSFYASQAFEGVHPLQSGLLRRKRRTDRRPGLPRETPLGFYPRRIKEMLTSSKAPCSCCGNLRGSATGSRRTPRHGATLTSRSVHLKMSSTRHSTCIKPQRPRAGLRFKQGSTPGRQDH
jgi:hypothetical protein